MLLLLQVLLLTHITKSSLESYTKNALGYFTKLVAVSFSPSKTYTNSHTHSPLITTPLRSVPNV